MVVKKNDNYLLDHVLIKFGIVNSTEPHEQRTKFRLIPDKDDQVHLKRDYDNMLQLGIFSFELAVFCAKPKRVMMQK